MDLSEDVVKVFHLIHKGAKDAKSMGEDGACVNGLSNEEIVFAAATIPENLLLREHLLLLPKWFTLDECIGFVQALSTKCMKNKMYIYLTVLGFYHLEKREYGDARQACKFANMQDVEYELLKELIKCTAAEVEPHLMSLTRDLTYKVRAPSYDSLNLDEVRY